GAMDYLPKPFTPAQIRHLVDKAAAERALLWRISNPQGRFGGAAPGIGPDSDSGRGRSTTENCLKTAPPAVPALRRGESGTGESVLARMIHSTSPRGRHPFVVVNCPTLSEELLASELFGHARGAFTGAVRDQAGRVEAAEGGTLFLDEIGEIA